MLQRREDQINWLADSYWLCVHTGIIITLSIVSPNMPGLKYEWYITCVLTHNAMTLFS